MSHPPRQGQPIPRSQFLAILQSALNIRQTRFVRQAAAPWLEVFPGDLQVRLCMALALVYEARTEPKTIPQAATILEEICRADPEYLEAQQLRASLYRTIEDEKAPVAGGCVFALLAGDVPASHPSFASAPTPWSEALGRARQVLSLGMVEEAHVWMQKVLKSDAEGQAGPDIPLIGITHLKILQQKYLAEGSQDLAGAGALAQVYHQRWPYCIPIALFLAASYMSGGESERGVALLHQSAAQDVSGEIAVRLWGSQHPYRSLWRDDLAAPLDLPIPAGVAAILGWNQLPAATITSGDDTAVSVALAQEPASEPSPASHGSSAEPPHAKILEDLDQIARSLQQPHLVRSDGRFPVYIVWSTRQGLISQYGEQAFEEIDRYLHELAGVIDRRQGWNAALLYADDPPSAAELGIKPVPHRDAYALKLSLADLDAALGQRGQMIGAVLIVGGPEVLPFHSLPNPMDDVDLQVYSDNPYTARDENYFVPEWPLGRITGGIGRDSEILLSLIRQIIERHKQPPQEKSWFLRLLEFLLGFLLPPGRKARQSLGYTAAIWQDAAHTVFKSIGGASDLLVSPPQDADGFANGSLNPAHLGYFNLHGVEDAPEWFGQRDPAHYFEQESDHAFAGDDYPVALRPSNLSTNNAVPQFIFTEACYGGHIVGKSVDQALSLKFLTLGTQAIAAATCTAYGSVTPPLSAADMLALSFWQYLNDGLPAGEALRHAKIDLVDEMTQKQGFLDGEDQKTLIQFVLYGDPLATIDMIPSKHRRLPVKEINRSLDNHAVKTIQEKASQNGDILDSGRLESVKNAVAKYLPGMEGARLSLTNMHPEAAEAAAPARPGKPLPKVYSPERLASQIVTLHKQVEAKSINHQHYARFTLDQNGKVIKMTVSR